MRDFRSSFTGGSTLITECRPRAASLHEGGRRIFSAVALQLFMGLLVTFAVVLALPIQAAQVRSYTGRPVADILQELQTAELRIIFSTPR